MLTTFFLRAFGKLWKATASSSCLSVRPSVWKKPGPNGRIFMKFDIWAFLQNLSRKSKFHQNMTRITGTFHAVQYTFMIISRPFLLRMRNFSDKPYRENQYTYCIFNNVFFFRKWCCLWDKVKNYCTARQATDYNMACAHWMLDT
jgi:hypothetical protein